MKKKAIRDLVLEYFYAHPNVDLRHGPVVDYVEVEYTRNGGDKPRDTWRVIRKLHQEGILIKVCKGIYRYEPRSVKNKELSDFTPEVKEAIFKRDEYKCVVCGRGRVDGVELCADHMKPKDKGGKSTVENGQTLCGEHNLLKKNYSQTETGKKYFIRLYESAFAVKDERLIKFCQEVFDAYNNYKINGHIARPNGHD